MTKLLKVSAYSLCIVLLSACGLTSKNLITDPGYAKLETPKFWEADKEVSLSLGPTILGFASSFIEDEEEVAKLMKTLKGINLRVYNVEDNGELLADYLTETSDQLNTMGWEQLASVYEDDEQVSIMIKLNEEMVSGVVVLVLDRTEAVFINLIGNIDPSSIQPIVAGLYDDAPDLSTTL